MSYKDRMGLTLNDASRQRIAGLFQQETRLWQILRDAGYTRQYGASLEDGMAWLIKRAEMAEYTLSVSVGDKTELEKRLSTQEDVNTCSNM